LSLAFISPGFWKVINLHFSSSDDELRRKPLCDSYLRGAGHQGVCRATFDRRRPSVQQEKIQDTLCLLHTRPASILSPSAIRPRRLTSPSRDSTVKDGLAWFRDASSYQAGILHALAVQTGLLQAYTLFSGPTVYASVSPNKTVYARALSRLPYGPKWRRRRSIYGWNSPMRTPTLASH